jgi:S1-C subfamily serine protease
MRAVFVWVSLAMIAAPAFAGERTRNPSDAVVLIRLTGSVHAQVEELGQRNTFDRDRVEIGSGTGFVISPDGYVLTNEHVVGPSEITINEGRRKGTITLKPTRIEVCFPREVAAALGMTVECSDASIAASDSALDLALLSMSAANVPYLALGDSDAISPGQPTQALGFPFGQQLSLDSGPSARAIPEITTTSGTISAVRSTADTERRYLQVSANVNPGNSGGPLIDRDGFVVGVIRSRLRDATGIAFAIPINQAKAFFESRGLDSLIPGRPIRLGAVHNLESKGLSLRLPEGFADDSALRLRVEAASRGDELSLRIDRVFSPLSLRQLEQQLIDTQTFERLSTISNESRVMTRAGSPTLLVGEETASATDTGAEARVVYTILDLGREKLLARYVGSTEQVAFNESVLRASLASLEGQPVIVAETGPIARLEWPSAPAAEGQRLPPFPAEWIIEPSAPSPCPGLTTANGRGAAVSPQDFTLMLRAAVWTTSAASPEDAAAACASRRGSLGPASYVLRADWLGVSYTIEGTFVRLDGRRLLQMEVLSTDVKAAAARTLLAEWTKRAIE